MFFESREGHPTAFFFNIILGGWVVDEWCSWCAHCVVWGREKCKKHVRGRNFLNWCLKWKSKECGIKIRGEVVGIVRVK